MAEKKPRAKRGEGARARFIQTEIKPVLGVQWDAYRAACKEANKGAMTGAANLVKRGAQRNARQLSLGRPHRVRRKYPSGKYYEEPKRLYQTIVRKVREQRDARGVLAWVRATYGYGVWVEYGTKNMKAPRGTYSFLRRALRENIDRIMTLLREQWPK